MIVADLLRIIFIQYNQGCIGAGTRGNGAPTPLSSIALKWL